MVREMRQRKTVLLTGASYGFGYELAKLFARDGFDLVLVARSEERLQQLAQSLRTDHGVEVEVIAKDLFLPDACQQIYQQLKEQGTNIDVLVNNAGFGTYGKFAEIELEKDMNLVQLNVATVTLMTKLFIADMVQRGAGKILNVASMAAYMSGPYMATYFASKAYVMSFSEALAEEVKGSGVEVMALCPGVAATNFQQTAENESALIGGKIKGLMMSAEDVVQEAYRDFNRGKVVSIPGASNKMTVLLTKLLPRALMRKAVKVFNSSKDL